VSSSTSKRPVVHNTGLRSPPRPMTNFPTTPRSYHHISRIPTSQFFTWLMSSFAVHRQTTPPSKIAGTGLPPAQTSPWMSRIINSAYNSPTAGPISPTVIQLVTSAPVLVGGGEVIRCQVQLANNYQEMLNISGSSSVVYGRELGAGIAWLCRVDRSRISDVNVFQNPETGLTSLRYCKQY